MNLKNAYQISAPAGFEPATSRLTATRSKPTELIDQDGLLQRFGKRANRPMGPLHKKIV